LGQERVIAGLRELRDRFLGRGEAAITVPPFDGALKPNNLLEEAAVAVELEAPEDIASDGSAVFIADGAKLLRLERGGPAEIARFDRPLTAVAALPGGAFAVALDGREVRLMRGNETVRQWSAAAGKPFLAVNAVSPAPDGTLLVTDGSERQPYARWCHDLMELGESGRALVLDPKSGEARVLTSGLAYAFGVCAAAGGIYVSESWRHRLRCFGDGRAVLDRLPAYPSRLSPATGGGFWLTAFIARTQLVEFVLREPAFRKRMMREIEPRYWVAPALVSGATYLEPMQGAHIKTMGILKPWAPPRSYGLVIRLAADGLPRYSLHSRVDGVNHGVTAAVECRGELFILAKGRRRLLRLSLAAIATDFDA
jgi:hypothetical protein